MTAVKDHDDVRLALGDLGDLGDKFSELLIR
jgi:hypothetical protein